MLSVEKETLKLTLQLKKLECHRFQISDFIYLAVVYNTLKTKSPQIKDVK